MTSFPIEYGDHHRRLAGMNMQQALDVAAATWGGNAALTFLEGGGRTARGRSFART